MHKRSVVSVSLPPWGIHCSKESHCLGKTPYSLPFLFACNSENKSNTLLQDSQTSNWPGEGGKLLCSTSAPHGRDFDCILTSKTLERFQCSRAVINSWEHSRAQCGACLKGQFHTASMYCFLRGHLLKSVSKSKLHCPHRGRVIPSAWCHSPEMQEFHGPETTAPRGKGRVQIKLNSSGSASASSCSKSYKDSCKWFGVILVGMI